MKQQLSDLAERFRVLRIDPDRRLCVMLMTPECRDMIVKELEEMIDEIKDRAYEAMGEDC